ncbi:MAG TPA: GNAT family N-acetyltransferase [Hyphomicrobiales bacterium]|nr:GNAT family N-acetyltransferase [Hyphomicrobiales bacterium]
MTIAIRPAAAADLAAIAAIYGEAVATGTASFELVPPGRAEMTRRFETLRAGGFPYLVAADEAGRVLGYAYAGPYRPRAAYGLTVEDAVYVAADARRLGVGRALLAALVEAATAAGFRQMIAVIGDSANAGSVGVHAAAGFRMVGTFEAVGRKHGRWLDTVLMQRSLGDGDTAPPEREP